MPSSCQSAYHVELFFRTLKASCSSVQLTAFPHQRIFGFCAPPLRARGPAGPSPPSLIDNPSSVIFATVFSGRGRHPALHEQRRTYPYGRAFHEDRYPIVSPLESAFKGRQNVKSFRIRTYEKAVSNPFRICTYKKSGRGVSVMVNQPAAAITRS